LPRYRLLSDAGGRISHVLMALPAHQPEVVPRLLECQVGLLAALGPGARCTMVHHPEHAGLIASGTARPDLDLLAWTAPATLRFSRATFEGTTLRLGSVPWGDFTVWVQDPFLVGRAAGGSPTLLASPAVERPDGGLDEDLAPLVAAHLGWPCVPLPLPLDGANVLVCGDSVVLGGNALTDPPGLDRLRSQVDARELIAIPSQSPQPLGHQDLYLALAQPTAGTRVALVGSRTLAARVLNQPADRSDRDDRLDVVAGELEAAGYRVHRLPLAQVRPDPRWKPGWVSYANALVESWDDRGTPGRRVILARYGTDGGPALADLDLAAAEIWAGLGYQVAWAEGPFTWLSVFEGGVRCLTKVLDRA
jgi:hypothetical protein